MARPKKAVDVSVSAIVTNKGENCVELRLRTGFGMERAYALPPDLARTMANMTLCCAGFVERTLEVSQFFQGDAHGEQSPTIECSADAPTDAEQRREREDHDARREAQPSGDAQDA